ncbi:hypothetical protein ADK38_26845, partial [Streptomyces varsoviensis]
MRDDAEGGGTEGGEPVGVELLIAVPDQPGVLPAAAGVLALHRLTVRAADLRTVPVPEELWAVPVPEGPRAVPVGEDLLAVRPPADPG